MPDDALKLSDVLAALPQEADYDVAYAALAATQQGRWFLREFADRNRHADTHMLLGALVRVEAAMRGDPEPRIPAFLAREFVELGAALGRIEAEIAASGLQAEGSLAATERIQDVAFALRDREVDSRLCDALEVAVSELGSIVARNEAAVERVQNAASLLRQLSGRINSLVAQAAVGSGVSVEPLAAAAAAAAADAGAMPQTAAFTSAVEDETGADDVVEEDAVVSARPQWAEEDARKDESFAAAVGALAASFPPVEEAGGKPTPEPQGQPDAVGLPPTDETSEGENEVEPASDESMAASAANEAPPGGSAAVPAESGPPTLELMEYEAAERDTAEHDTAEQAAVAGISPERSAAEMHVADDPSEAAEAPETIKEMVEEATIALAMPLSADAPSGAGAPEANPAGAMTTEAAPTAPGCSSACEAANELPSGEAILIASRASEPPANQEISYQESFSSRELRNQEPEGEGSASKEPATEQPASEELLAEETARGEVPSKEILRDEQSSSGEAPGEDSPCRHDIVERADQPAQPCAGAVDIAAGHASDIKSAHHNAGWLLDTSQVPAIEALPAAVCGHHSELPRQAGSDLSALTESQTAAGPEEDPGDLFEPLPPPDPLRQAELPEPLPTVPSPRSPARSSPEESAAEESVPERSPPQSRASGPMVRGTARPTPTDPLAGVRTLSEEELVALFS